MEYAVRVNNLVKVYDGRVRALDGVDLTVDAGEFFALLGPNGAGKTTLMRILTTQLRPTAGEAYVFGYNVVRDEEKVRRLISYVPQEISVWTDISGYENLLIYAKIFGVPSHQREKIIDEALENMGLSDVKNELVRTYSGGMIRRLEIACAVLVKPKIMFLDEPTIGLDPAARKAVWERLKIFKEEYGVTIFFNTHYMDEADMYADELAIINQGKIVTRGTSQELKQSLGGDVITFMLKNETNDSRILQEIRKLEFVKNLFVYGSNINVVVEDAEVALLSLLNAVKDIGLTIEKISIAKPTLDDVFLKYAGTRLEDKNRLSEVTRVREMIRKG